LFHGRFHRIIFLQGEGLRSGGRGIAGRRGEQAMKIALGVTGGIAAYKAAEIVRHLQERGVEVQVVMTRAAQ
jgi:hypothetical protein